MCLQALSAACQLLRAKSLREASIAEGCSPQSYTTVLITLDLFLLERLSAEILLVT